MTKKTTKHADDPGDFCLVPAGTVKEYPIAAHCTCEKGTRGWWLVEKADGTRWQFDPPTQLQKDIWLGARGMTKEQRMAMLRWLCLGCGKVQMP